MSIGPFSRASGLSAKALRHYDEVGLLKPAWVNPASGYRRYQPIQLDDAELIRVLAGVGYPLAEIRALLERRRADPAGSWLAELGSALQRQRSAAARRVRRSDQMLEVFQRMAANVAFVERVLARLHQLPEDARLAWGEATATAARPFVVESAAVVAPRLQDRHATGRVWLVCLPDVALGPHHPPELTIRAEPDLDVHSAWDPGAKSDRVAIAVPRATGPGKEQVEALRAASATTGSEVSVSRAWSTAAVTALVSRWILDHTGRVDIKLRFDHRIKDGAAAAALRHFAPLGFTTTEDVAQVIRVGRGDMEVGLAAMPQVDRAAAADALLRLKGD